MRSPGASVWQAAHAKAGSVALVLAVVAEFGWLAEVEHIEHVADRRHVCRDPRVLVGRDRVRQIVPAAVGYGPKMPVPLNELRDRSLVGIGMVDLTASRIRRDNDRHDARSINE